jgi:exoribonuclease-2
MAQRSDLVRIARRALVDRGLLADFSAEAKREADAAHEPPPDGSVVDQRELLWCSIDNDDSRDLDQLSVAIPTGADTKLLVAIADVDAIVKKGSAIDMHAFANTTSVYTAAAVFPMLPERLSTDLTSLGQDEDRYAIVAELIVTPNGDVREARHYRALVRNRAKLAYDAVAAWLDGKAPPPPPLHAVMGLEDNLRVQDRVAAALRARRRDHGSLSLQTPEARAVWQGDLVVDLRVEEQNRAQLLIEAVMVAANGATARLLDDKGLPSLRRVLKSPERWAKLVELAASFGVALPLSPDGVALEAFLEKRRAAAPDRFADLSLSVVKLLGRGEYAVQRHGRAAVGHFGLAVKDYTHSTAPNRRFPDLVTQRLIKAALGGTPSPYGDTELDEIAARCNAKEEAATKVERQLRKSAAALLLERRIGDRFSAIVSGASDKGVWVHVDHPAAEGKVVRGGEGLSVGQRVSVELLRTDVEQGFIDFAAT